MDNKDKPKKSLKKITRLTNKTNMTKINEEALRHIRSRNVIWATNCNKQEVPK